ncbi:DUF4302 domain-containing protein [uncultured Sphingobacterium sp.]|uniref:DUF4302 domain-containing protein n=1 Tax=uncultured Sphingobacterium sp. TaxID=182688 RepID=UPI0025D451FD|nr:DUF4302 domain-containing protein [uncultured Sphingobacterium sp.]
MKLKYLIVLILLPFLLVTSCKRDEDRIFDANATVRMTEAVEKTYTVLQANKAGWIMKFYPSNNQEFGGYTIFSKFISNAEVTVASDPFSGSLTSSYSVSPESGPVLTFNGYNKNIHWFSEPGKDNGGIGADDSGMRGDFEFIVLKATADSVVLKGKKSGSHLVMLPLKGDEFETMAASYQEAANMFKQFGVFNLETKDGESAVMRYSPKMRVFGNPLDQSAKGMAFRVVPGGLEFYEKYTMAGVTFDFLKFIEPTSTYPYGYYTDNGNTFKIVPEVTPINLWFKANLWSMSYRNVGPIGQVYWNNAKNKLKANGITLNNMYIGNAGVEVLYYVLQNGAVEGAVGHNITPVSGTVDQVRITFTGSLYNVVGFTAAYWTGGLSEFTTPLNGRTFRITSDEVNEPSSVLLTDVAAPTNTFRVFLKDINDPLNN